ncbi:MAG: oxidoreductase [Gemmatales bacterium]|nr:MAG: oxidoreductase [Gemmatales bacterium]
MRTVFASALVLVFAGMCPAQEKKVLRAGIIGLDTSHVVAFTKALNDPNAKGPLADVKVVAAYPGGSPDVTASRTRVKGFTETLRNKYKVEIVDSIEALLPKVDVILLESVDGRPHLKQAIPVFKAGKPIFIDKPVAGSLADAIEIFELAKKYKVPCFSSSSLRFSSGIIGMRNDSKVGKVIGCSIYAPCSLEEHHPDLFWYGVHGCEMLFTIMGTGCESVSRTNTKGTDVVVGKWKDGRIGTFRGIRDGRSGYGGLVFGSKAIVPVGRYEGYIPLLVEICKFFKTGKAPVSAEETIEIFAFMEAADESKRQNGAPVKIADVIEKARSSK